MYAVAMWLWHNNILPYGYKTNIYLVVFIIIHVYLQLFMYTYNYRESDVDYYTN